MLKERPNKRNGLRLEHSIILDFREGLLAEPEDEDEAWDLTSPYESYQGRPVEFCRDIFNAQFTEEIEDMMNSAQENPATLAKSANGVGKTYAAACFILYFFLVYGDAQVYTAAAPPEDNLKRLLWGEIGAIVERFPEVFKAFSVSLASLTILRNRRSFIVGLAIPQAQDKHQIKARFSGKHAPHILFVFDEGDGVPEAVYKAVESCMSGGMARLLILFNPRSESGPVYKMEKAQEGKIVNLQAFSHPNVVTGKDIIPGAVDREQTVRRIMLWTEPLPRGEMQGTDTFVIPDFLKGYVAHRRDNTPLPPCPGGIRRIIEPDFYYMVLGMYPAMGEENQLISGAWVTAAEQRWQLWKAKYGSRPPTGVFPFMSYDVAELGQDSNVVTLWYGNWVAPQIKWGGVDVKISGRKATDLYKTNKCQWANVDATGIGAGAWAEMFHAGCVAHRIMVWSTDDLDADDVAEELGEFDSIRSQMLWALREWLRTDPGAMLPPGIERQQLTAPTYGKNSRGKISISSTDAIKEKIGHSPDELMSLALRFAKQPGSKSGKLGTANYAYGSNGKGSKNGRTGKLSMV